MKKIQKNKTSILIAEDEGIVAKDLKDTLTELGYKVLGIADTGKGIIEKAKKLKPDLIIMDIVLKDKIDGIEAAQEIKDQLSIPVIFLTAFADDSKMLRSKQAEPYGYILKPFKQKELQANIELALYSHQLRFQKDTITTEKLRLSKITAAEKELAEKYLNLAGSILVVLNSEGNITLLNEIGYKTLGYKQGSLLGKNWFDICMPKTKRASMKGVFKEIIHGNLVGFKSYENEVVTKSGETKLISWNNTNLWDENGKIIGALSTGQDITEQRKTEQNLRNEKRFSEAAMNSLPGIFYLFDKKGHFIKWNQNFEKVTGYSAKEMEKISPLDLFDEPDRSLIAKAIREVFTKGEATAEGLFKTKKGQKIPYYFTGHLMTQGQEGYLVGMGLDITERKRDEELIKRENERFQTIFVSSRDAIMTLQPADWNFTSGNPAAIELFACKSEKEFIGHGPWFFSPPKQPDGKDSKQKAKAMIMKALEEGSNLFEWTHRTKSGLNFPVIVLLTRVILGNKTILQATVRDITEQKQTEKKVEDKVEQMEFIGRINLKHYKEMMDIKKENKELRERLEKYES